MDLKNITKIIEIFEASKVSDLELESDDFKIKLSKKMESVTYEVPLAKEVKQEVRHNYTEIKSPIVGTYYKANSPTSAPFVSVGQEIKVGDVLCIVEAMKILNEIKSEVNGIVKEILVNDGDMIQFDQKLMLVEEVK